MNQKLQTLALLVIISLSTVQGFVLGPKGIDSYKTSGIEAIGPQDLCSKFDYANYEVNSAFRINVNKSYYQVSSNFKLFRFPSYSISNRTEQFLH